jgi:hypothetical protein
VQNTVNTVHLVVYFGDFAAMRKIGASRASRWRKPASIW